MAVSQSNTMWVKKGTVVNGKKVKKGYVAQKGKPEKRVTNKIKLVVDTDKRGKAGDTVQTKKGRYVKSDKKVQVTKPKSKGGGYTGSGPAGGTSVVKKGAAPTPAKPKDNGKTGDVKDTTKKDTGYNGSGDRKATSATVSSAVSQDKKNPTNKPKLGGNGKGLEGLSKIERTVYDLRSSNTDAPNKVERKQNQDAQNPVGYKPKRVRDQEFEAKKKAAAEANKTTSVQEWANRNKGERKGQTRIKGNTKQKWDGKQWLATHRKIKLKSGRELWQPI